MPAPQLFRCVCGGEYATQKRLDQHKRRYCRGAVQNEENKCESCGSTFGTYAGMRLHMKKAHADVYNRGLQEEANKPSRFWTIDEENELARAEAEYEGENLLDYLQTISSRSLHAIKCRRKQQSYKDKVESMKLHLQQSREISNNDVNAEQEQTISLNRKLRKELLGISASDLDERTARLKEDILTMPSDSARRSLEIWCEHLIREHGRARHSASGTQIAHTYKRLRERIMEPSRNSRRKRILKFRLAQLRYKNDRRAFANDLFDNTEGAQMDTMPRKEEIRVAYEEIFGTASVLDIEPVNTTHEYTEISNPISTDEIKYALKLMKDGAPGPDGISLEKLRKIRLAKLHVLFNAMLLLEYTPSQFKTSRTTLIPKTKENRDNIKNWRPITVSSMITRLLGKIIVKRLEVIRLHSSQRGFSRIDGCFANNAVLENLIKYRRKKGQPLSLISLDLQKAFDCVSHHSIGRALRRLNVDNKFVNFVEESYSSATTTIFCGDQNIGSFCVKRGVKQGDPLSPFLFNAVLDELLNDLHQRTGVPVGQDSKVCCLAYADDLILVATTPEDAARMLNICKEFFTKRGLALNVEKCKAIVLKTVPSKKKLCVVTEPTFQVGNAWIPQLNISEEFRYLGQKFNVEGAVPCNDTNLNTQLVSLLRSPLKPQQKFDLLKSFLMPRYIASLQRPNVTKKLLRKVDLRFRTAAKKILHLPSHCSNSVFYAPLKLGGLGMFNFEKMIPIISLSRWKKLEQSDDQLQAAFLLGINWRNRLQSMIGDTDTSTKDIKKSYGEKLEESFSGNGTYHTKFHSACSKIISNPPRYWSGEDYIRAVHLRLNLLPSKGLPYNRQDERRCRAGCNKVESLSHILQNCPATHWERIRRHDYVLKRLVTGAKAQRWKATIEPHIRCTDGRLRKPDVIFERRDKVIISDVAIHWEGSIGLAQQHQSKTAIYSEEPFIEELKRRYPDKSLYVIPLILGARGTWCKQNDTLIEHLDLKHHDVKDLITTSMRGGWIIHSSFMRRVWQQ